MFATRPSLIGAVIAAALCAAPVLADETAGASAPQANQALAQIRDIRVSAQGREFQALVVFNAQPTGAKAQLSPAGVTLTLSGLSLERFDLDPLDKGLVTDAHGEGMNGRSQVELACPRLTEVSTTLYRRSVLITGALAEPAPNRAAPSPAIIAQPPQYAQAPRHAKPMTLTQAAGLDAAACAAAASAVAADPWDLAHLGDHALCNIASGDMDAARMAVEQLEAFAPDDWRVGAARGELHFLAHETSEGVIAYRNAIALCDDDDARDRLGARLAMLSAR